MIGIKSGGKVRNRTSTRPCGPAPRLRVLTVGASPRRTALSNNKKAFNSQLNRQLNLKSRNGLSSHVPCPLKCPHDRNKIWRKGEESNLHPALRPGSAVKSINRGSVAQTHSPLPEKNTSESTTLHCRRFRPPVVVIERAQIQHELRGGPGDKRF